MELYRKLVSTVVLTVIIYSVWKYLFFCSALNLHPFDKEFSLKNQTPGVDSIYDRFTASNPKFSEEYYDNVDDYDDNLWGNKLMSLFMKNQGGGGYNAMFIRKHVFSPEYEYELLLNPVSDSDTILDCGPGSGKFCSHVISNYPGATYYGITNSRKQCEHLKRKFKQNASVNFVYGSFDSLTEHFSSNMFDKVFFLETHGYSHARKKLFGNVHFVLKPEGRCLIKSPSFPLGERDSTFIKDLTHSWGYNFSNVHSQLLDLDSCGFSQMQYNKHSFLFAELHALVRFVLAVYVWPMRIHRNIYSYFETWPARVHHVAQMLLHIPCSHTYFIVCSK